MKYIVGLAMVGVVLLLMGEYVWAMAYFMWLGGFTLGLFVCWHLIIEAFSRNGDGGDWNQSCSQILAGAAKRRRKRNIR